MGLLPRKLLLKHLWQSYAMVYDGLRHFYPYKHLLQLQADRLQVPPKARIIDLGCGTGNMLPLIAAKYPDAMIVGVDPTAGMLRKAARKARKLQANITLKSEDALEFLRTQPSASIDAVIMSNVLYTINDRVSMWKELLRVLKPTSEAIITNSDRAGSKPIIKEHVANDSRWKLFIPTLFLTGAIDALISSLSESGDFHFIDRNTLEKEVAAAGGTMRDPVRCYGGDVDGVNLLFTVTPR
jgi:ubiquinone/menaquinone biosynthesis C-methylase UbiE